MTSEYNKQFTVYNLKDRMVVELRDSSRALIVGEWLLFDDCYSQINSYRCDLTSYHSPRLDIIKIFAPIRSLDILSANTLLWKRNEEEALYKIIMTNRHKKVQR